MLHIVGIGPDAETVTNERGGKQSKAVAGFHLMDAPTMIRLAKVLQYGANRYERDNWRKISCEDHLNHALIHIFAAFAGDQQDDHLGHAFCRLMMACATEHDGSLSKRAEVSNQKLDALRAEALASGMKLLSDEEVVQEVQNRRCGAESHYPTWSGKCTFDE